MGEPRWLSRDEQSIWRRYLAGVGALTDQLDRELRQHHDLTMSEYEILVRLSETEHWQLRMAELAASSHQSRSRLSHAVDRLEHDGLVLRRWCEADRRGVWAQLADAGFARLEEAARTHVDGVRRYLVDAVGPADYVALGRAFAAVTAAVASADE
ncbi:MAG: MarR family winged helix-turn-helix transcriptional regulator [Streptosporangiales bacterium]